MERLTERTTDGILVKENYSENALRTFYQCFGEKPNDNYSNCEEGYCAMEKLAAYEDADEQGLLLPCKVGTQIYHFIYDFEEEKYMITKTRIIEVFENINGWYFRTLKDIPAFRLSDFCVCVFLTEEEAEAKLKEMEGAE